MSATARPSSETAYAAEDGPRNDPLDPGTADFDVDAFLEGFVGGLAGPDDLRPDA